ncbi:lipocalin family protein [uncultured Dokdonia sp.]|uniref:lipocalin family protein n=1 Tax=uncultured Dokdonia sp. TaxID=575653 RepID=UPI0026182E43|nr:lipocalin family protein [uncultured Dokdonia sp.]
MKPPYIIPENAIHLLTADSVKSWKIAKRYNGKTRMNMGDCFLKYRQRFRESGLVKDNNASQRDCGPSLEATWEITTSEKGDYYIKLTSDQLPELLNQESDEKFFKILYLSKDSLTLSYVHKQFNQRRRITDYMVREDLEVKDRDFHW